MQDLWKGDSDAAESRRWQKNRASKLGDRGRAPSPPPRSAPEVSKIMMHISYTKSGADPRGGRDPKFRALKFLRSCNSAVQRRHNLAPPYKNHGSAPETSISKTSVLKYDRLRATRIKLRNSFVSVFPKMYQSWPQIQKWLCKFSCEIWPQRHALRELSFLLLDLRLPGEMVITSNGFSTNHRTAFRSRCEKQLIMKIQDGTLVNQLHPIDGVCKWMNAWKMHTNASLLHSIKQFPCKTD